MDSETRLEGTIGTTVDGEAKMRQKALSQLKESVLTEVSILHSESCTCMGDVAVLTISNPVIISSK